MATWNSNGTVSDIQGIHDNNASTGDTITLPSGTFTWSSGVTITKGITLQGAGLGSTILNRGGGFGSAFVRVVPPTDVPVRVTGIRFNSTVGAVAELISVSVEGPYGGSFGLTQVRIDHCYFEGGFRTIFLHWRINGVADNNTFHNCVYITEHYGDDDFAWTRAGTPSFGTSDAFFFEDNSIIQDNSFGSTFDTLSDQNTGGKLVWRHNSFDTTAYSGSFGSLIGSHGNQALWTGVVDNLRGGIMQEIYNNIVSWGSAFRILWFRGGRIIVANNTFTGTIGSGAIVAFDEEEMVASSGVPQRTTYPGEDQINNTFIFNNTLNGSALPSARIFCWQANSDTCIQVNRDYWLQAPSVSTTTTYSQPGSPSLPGYPMPYNPSVTSWTPYTYPHPLRDDAPVVILGAPIF